MVGVRVGLAADLPLLSWNRGPIRQAQAEAEQLEARRFAVVERLRTLLSSAQTRLAASIRKAKFYQETQLPLSRQVEEMARLAYSLGKAPLVSVLQAQAGLATDEGQALEATLQAQVAFADLEEAAGEAR